MLLVFPTCDRYLMVGIDVTQFTGIADDREFLVELLKKKAGDVAWRGVA
jgi:hypothetical protein